MKTECQIYVRSVGTEHNLNQVAATSEHWIVMDSAKSHAVIRERVSHAHDTNNLYNNTCDNQNIFEEHHQYPPKKNRVACMVLEMVVDQRNSETNRNYNPAVQKTKSSM